MEPFELLLPRGRRETSSARLAGPGRRSRPRRRGGPTGPRRAAV